MTDAKQNSHSWIYDVNLQNEKGQNEKLMLIKYQSHQWC